ncbi:MAG: type I-U CRISPR-associated helicase/endonuclease Cas3 [Verrucomicrobiales bacterium]|nr:type I-U CRISPR-associated helicase/endonuclease Cas3 [Verrucomicrobiales bacterium]
MNPFPITFEQLTGSRPFPWQEALFDRIINGDAMPPVADIPTGLGKTSVVAIWLIALLSKPAEVPKRLVYVVNRRTVVDQTTEEVNRIRQRLTELPELLEHLRKMCAVSAEMPLALSTLRGQFADNREWCADPARPAVIVGTVDMIGSGLLFSRFTCGFKTRPHHAAFLGQDALLVHDEAHLEPAFQNLLDSIVGEQNKSSEAKPLHVLQLTATARNSGEAFTLTPADEEHETVSQRLHAKKHLKLISIEDEKPALLASKLSELALAKHASGRAILIFARTLDAVQKVASTLQKEKLPHEVLTGTMRGLERDGLIKKPILSRFLPPSSRPADSSQPHEGTCYLIATSAGEVGANLSGDDLICDLSTYESMAQRLGRVNRFGKLTDTVVEVIHPASFKNTDPDDAKFDPMEAARERTLALLCQLSKDASPAALRKLDAAERAQAFSPPPTIRPATDILFDTWAMTSIREPLPGRPPIAPYLHGETEWQPPETHVAWRSEVEIITDALAKFYDPEELLSEYPLKPHELLRSPSYRVRNELSQMVKRIGNAKASELHPWLVSNEGKVSRSHSLADLADKDNEALLQDATLLLAPAHGGLSGGLLEGKAPPPDEADVLDVSAINDAEDKPTRVRKRSAFDEVPEEFSKFNLRLKLTIDTLIAAEDLSESEEDEPQRYWLWLEAKKAFGADATGSTTAVTLEKHVADVVGHARNIAAKLGLSESLSRCIILAAQIHDLGKRRTHWQQGIGNYDKAECFAKSGKHPFTGKKLKPRPGLDPYRHEFGSLLDVLAPSQHQEADKDLLHAFTAMTDEEKDIVLHLVAAHHGRARPHFPMSPADETFDPGSDFEDTQKAAAEVPQRFARLQHRFGRWGLAYLESLLRAADYAASAEIEPLPLSPHA